MPLDGVELDPGIVGSNIAAARRRNALSQAELARRLGISRPTLIALESGQRPPAPPLLATIAETLGARVRDLVSLPPADEQAQIRFRDPLRSDDSASAAVDSLTDFGRAYLLLEDLAITKLGGKRFRPAYIPPVSIDDVEDVEHAAEDLAAAERARLSLGDGPIDIRAVLEQEVGVLAFGLKPLKKTKIAGIFTFAHDLPLVAFNLVQADPRRQCWTLAHEYAHFLTNRYDAEITYESTTRRSRNRHEQFAEAFAANFLMPTSGVSRRFARLVGSAQHATLAHIILLASQFRVSFQAMCERLEMLGRIPRNTYAHAMDRGLRPLEAERSLGIERRDERLEPYPVRFIYLIALLRRTAILSEGDVAQYLQTDRLTARGVLDAFETETSYPIDKPLERGS